MGVVESLGRTEIRHVAADGRWLLVIWGDGHQSRFHAIWLRFNCACEACGSTASGIRHLRLTDIPPDIAAASAALDAQGRLAISWAGDGHRTVFEPAWLRARCYSAKERDRRRFRPVLWGPEIIDDLPEIGYGAVCADAAGHLRMLELLRDYGFVVVRGVPPDAAETEKVTSLVGPLRVTNYGRIYDFISKPVPLVKGDTGVRLEPHTDEAYRHSPPGIMFFHVLAASGDGGGASIMVDGFAIAETFRAQDPQAFDLLSNVPQQFHRLLTDDRDFRAQARIFSLDFEGHVVGFRLLDRGAAPMDLPEDMIEPAYAALRTLLEMIYREQNQLCIALEAGDVLVFNNQRVMHGRTAFDRAGGGRHIRSCHVELDEFYSSLRMLYRHFGREEVDMVLPGGAAA